MAQWFKTSVRYNKTMENGLVKKVTDNYLVDALSFTEAEARTIEEVTPLISGEFTVTAAKRSKIEEIFYCDGGKSYLVKIAFLTVDEKTAVEKRSIVQMIVQSTDFEGALEDLKVGMKNCMADWEIVSIAETNILDVFKAKLNGSQG